MLDMEAIRRAVLKRYAPGAREHKGKRLRAVLVPTGCLIEFYEERAAVLEFDEGLSREEAERMALEQSKRRFRVYELRLEA